MLHKIVPRSFPLLLYFLASISFCSFSIVNIYYQTECVSIEADGYVSIKIWNTKLGKSYKPEQARADAVHALLYSGISGTNGCLTQEALLVKSEDIEKFKKIEKDFFGKNGKWAQFTRSSATETTLPVNLGVKNWKVYQVSIAKDALRKYLIEKTVISSINKGF